jgi:hypothetical protein
MYQYLDNKKKRLKWLGHVHRMSSQRGPKLALEGNRGGRRRRADLGKGGETTSRTTWLRSA